MIEYWVDSESGVLDMWLGGNSDILIHNDLHNPCGLIYLLLPEARDGKLCWKNNVSLSGPEASLVMLTKDDVEIYNSDFSDFNDIVISDNKYHRDGRKFVVIEQDQHQGNIVTFDRCQANNAYFLCKALEWFQGHIKDNLYVELHGQDTSLHLKGFNNQKLTIGNILLSETIKPNKIRLEHLEVQNNLVCYAQDTLSLHNVLCGSGRTLLQAEEIERLSDLKGNCQELIIKADMATLSNFMMPRGKVYIDSSSFLDFKSDGDGSLTGVDLYIDVSENLDSKTINLPAVDTKFDRMFITGANGLKIAGSLVARVVELTNCLAVTFNNSNIGQLKYDTDSLTNVQNQGKLTFEGRSHATVGSIFSKGYNQVSFWASAEVVDFDNSGLCDVSIYDEFTASILKLNLDINQKDSAITSNEHGFWGLFVHNKGDKQVKIETILAKCNRFEIKGAVTFGKVICQPIDKYDNLLEVDSQHLGQTIIESFFAGYDHDIAIDKNTGKISLIQSINRALKDSTIIANLQDCNLSNHLVIRAGSGLSFQGAIEVINGDIELFTLFGQLSARGSLKAQNLIQLIAEKGEIDLSAELNARTVVTYAGTSEYVKDSVIKAESFLATVVGSYVQLDSSIAAAGIKIVSQNSDVIMVASRLHAIDLELQAANELRMRQNNLQTNSGLLQGQDVLVDETDILGSILEFKGSNNVGLIGNNIEGDKVSFQGEELDIIQSNLRTTQIDTEAKISRIAESQIIGKQKHKASEELLIERSRLVGEYIQNISQGKLKIDQSVMVGKVIMQGAKDDLQIKDSRMIGSYVTNASGGSMKVDSNQIIGSQELYFAAISQYLLANSGLSLAQYPHQLFTGNFGAIDSAGNPVIRCGIAIDGNEMLGIINFGSCSSDEFANLQYEVINSSNIPLSVFQEIAKKRPKGVYIDADSGIIIGGSLDAGKHQVMLKTKKGIDILPLGVYNSLMFGGGINATGIYHAITKIAAGLIDIDGGQIIKLVGVQFQGHVGQLKADYIINEDNVGEVIARAGVFSELKPWLGNAVTYDLIINKNVVPTKLEFTETTKIELGKGKIDILYPYSSKKVFLTQKQGDVVLDQDLDVSKHELMAINAENGSILFGLPKTEQQEIIPKLFKMFGIGSGIIQTHSTHNNINVKAQELQLKAGGDVDIHGSLEAKNIGVKAKGQFKLSSDTSNFGKALEQSVVKADNWYVIADDIEINGSLVTVKDQVKLVSNNSVRILPVELLSHYYECSGKTTIKEDAIHQVVSRINAGYLNIDAGKAVDFVSALIEVENLNLEAKSLNISTAKEIFTKQVEFRGSDKWYGAKGSYSREYNHYEKVVPTVINTKNQRIVIDGQATLESAQIFAEEDILFEAKEGIAIKDGYNVHLHDYHEKKYTLMSFNGGSMKVNSNKTVKDFFSQHTSVPTIIAAKGHFFGITEGKMHILGSKIVGKDIHIVAPKGLKLEASRYTDSAFTFVHETGSKLGYYHKGNSEGGFAAGVYMNKSKLNTELQHVHESMLCAEDTLSLSIKDGTFEQISSSIRGKLIRVEALNWEARTYSNKVISDHLQQHAELGIKLCAKQNVTQVFDKMNGLVSKRGNHVIDHADRLFKAYDTYKSMAMLPTTATSSGLYAYLDMQETTEHRSSAIAVDNIIDGKDIMFRVENDIRFKGVKMTAANVDIEACNFEWETSSDQYEYEYNLGSVGIEVDLVNGANSSMQQAVKDLQSDKKIHHENYIKATGNLKLHLSGAGHFIGCSLEGATLDIKANNLILESVQDIISERLAGMSMHLGFDSAYNAQQIGLNVESGFKKAKWSNQVGQILGSQMVNVVVNETLELAGGIIANQKIDEDGKVTDEANLNINCSRLIVKTIHDYDEGVTLGIGASFQVHKTDNGNDVAFSHMPLKVKYKDQQRDLHGTIGQGNIKSDTIEGDSLNRDIKKTADTTASEEFGFDAAVHKSMFVGDSKTDEDKSLKKLYRSMVQEGTFMQKLANSATDIAGNIKDTGKNLVLGGAKLINIFGGQIDRDLLDQKLHEIIGKDIHTGIDVKEQERHIAKIQREIDTLSESEDLDYEKESDREHAYNKIAYVALFNKLEEAIKKIKDTKEQSYLTTTNIILQAEYKEELKKAKQDNRPVKSVEVFVNEFLTSEKFNKPVFNAAKQTVMHSVSGAKAIVDSLVEMIKQEGANLSISDIWDAIKPNSGIAAGEDYKALAQEESSVDNAEYGEKVDSRQITEEVSKEALHNSLIVLKASELGLPISQLVSDPKAYDMSLDVLNLDLTIAALNNYADTRDGAAAGAASRISKELVDIRKEVIKGGPSFSSVWKKTKDNLKSGKTTILNPTAVNLDAIGNMVSYVEDKVGYILASNMPKTTATLKAGFGYAMEKVIETGLEGAVEVFGQENVKSAKNSLERRLNWVDENYTKGQQKLLEYAGLYAATKVLSKVIAAIKHNKIPYLSEDLIPSLSKQEAHGVKILEKNGLNDELRNFSTAHEWKEFPDYVAHLDTKLPDVQGIKTSYPDGKGTLGIKKEWNRGHNEAVIKRAKPDSEHACQQVDYVSLKSNGQVLAKDGSFITKKPDGLYKAHPQKNNSLAPDSKTEVKLPYIEGVNKPYKHPDAHIPLSEWIKWKEWNKP